jgi:hypothetical protein
MFTSTYLEGVMVAFVSIRAVNHQLGQLPLPDLGFDSFASCEIELAYCGYEDVLLWTTALVAVFAAFCRNHWSSLRSMCFLWGIASMIRGVSMLCTGMPNPSLKCYQLPKMSIWLAPFHMMQFYKSEIIASELCGTAGISGHGVLLTVVALLWGKIFTKIWILLIPFWAFVAGQFWYMLACRFHYTADLLWALVFVVLSEPYVTSACERVHEKFRACHHNSQGI